jgi:5-methylcytosine-specific restriction enzyme A
MARRSLSTCAQPGCPVLSRYTWCNEHKPQRTDEQRHRSSWSWRQISARAVADHRALHGDWCPGYDRAPHAATDLTTDHVHPLARGGDDRTITVLCRSCNSRKGARPTP